MPRAWDNKRWHFNKLGDKTVMEGTRPKLDWAGKGTPAEEGVKEACTFTKCKDACHTHCAFYKNALLARDEAPKREEYTRLLGLVKELRKKPKTKKRKKKIKALKAKMEELREEF